eukprot:CAMPEP_0195124292 /NCGR_PEP_ID=MMETSP0448-20130528/130448_1 /TAXON_ID=66468 /ORGANISM="Heterocapsa triquestra, Strain CCMP 448" /LENGTH=193 /DNA_ID=CAMNT_0040161875 /DNA_START=186 /DNA_END=762 /DNA_ORIENTATION=-
MKSVAWQMTWMLSRGTSTGGDLGVRVREERQLRDAAVHQVHGRHPLQVLALVRLAVLTDAVQERDFPARGGDLQPVLPRLASPVRSRMRAVHDARRVANVRPIVVDGRALLEAHRHIAEGLKIVLTRVLNRLVSRLALAVPALRVAPRLAWLRIALPGEGERHLRNHLAPAPVVRLLEPVRVLRPRDGEALLL